MWLVRLFTVVCCSTSARPPATPDHLPRLITCMPGQPALLGHVRHACLVQHEAFSIPKFLYANRYDRLPACDDECVRSTYLRGRVRDRETLANQLELLLMQVRRPDRLRTMCAGSTHCCCTHAHSAQPVTLHQPLRPLLRHPPHHPQHQSASAALYR